MLSVDFLFSYKALQLLKVYGQVRALPDEAKDPPAPGSRSHHGQADAYGKPASYLECLVQKWDLTRGQVSKDRGSHLNPVPNILKINVLMY